MFFDCVIHVYGSSFLLIICFAFWCLILIHETSPTERDIKTTMDALQQHSHVSLAFLPPMPAPFSQGDVVKPFSMMKLRGVSQWNVLATLSAFPMQPASTVFSDRTGVRSPASSSCGFWKHLFFSSLWMTNRGHSTAAGNHNLQNDDFDKRLRIGIVGGGIAGVSVAHALVKRLEKEPKSATNIDIVVFDAEHNKHDKSKSDNMQMMMPSLPPPHDVWEAATAKNGNSLVPGASFFIFSKPSALKQVLVDTVKDWYYQQKERLRDSMHTAGAEAHQNVTGVNHHHNEKDMTAAASQLFGEASPTFIAEKVDIPIFLKRNDDFHFVPPYFSLHLLHCLGLARNSTMKHTDERWAFVRFVRQYLYYTLLKSKEDSEHRAQQLYQLANANRAMYLSEVMSESSDGRRNQKQKQELREKIGHSQGFLSIYRNKKDADDGLEQVRKFGEQAEMIDWEQVLELVPRLKNMPIGNETHPLHVILRPNDYTANCDAFVRHWVEKTKGQGVNYVPFQVKKLRNLDAQPKTEAKALSRKSAPRFEVITNDGSTHKFDILVLAAGIHTPLLAAQLNAQEYCPTYPLRGFSLTVNAWQQEAPNGLRGKSNRNLLLQPFKLDAMYCSSTSPWMARWVGFGEFCGFHATAKDVPSLGPKVLVRYANALFPENLNKTLSVDDVLPCFRAMSPDDLPLIGEVSVVPGLYFHTGHGSLGWTIGLATGDCVAQAICDKLFNSTATDSTYALIDGSQIDRSNLSPNRFL